MDTQSAGFFKLTYALHHAYPRAEGSWERQKHTWHAHRHKHNARNNHADPALFSAATDVVVDGIARQNGSAGAAAHARADRPSCPNQVAARLRQHRRLGGRLAAPRPLAPHRQQQRRLREETGVDEKGPHPVAEPAASSSSMGVMALVGLEVSCSNKSNPGQRLVGYRCRRAAAGNGTHAHLSIVRNAARAASRRSRLPNSVRMRCLRTRGG